MSYQQLTVCGYLGSDPTTRTTPSGTTMTSISVATSERWKDRTGNPQERTTWFRVTLFDRLGEVAAEYLRKGSLVLVTGSVSTSPYINRSGEAAASLEVRARELKMLGPAPDRAETPGEGTAPAARNASGPAAAKAAAARGLRPPPQEEIAPAPKEEFDEDIPF